MAVTAADRPGLPLGAGAELAAYLTGDSRAVRPMTWGCTMPITLPIAACPPRRRGLGDRGGDRVGDLLVAELEPGGASAMTAASAVSLAAISSRPASANALAARVASGLGREDPDDVLVGGSRDCLPATSALATAVSTIRRVEERTPSRLLMAAVRSARRWSFSSLMGPIVPGVAALRG